MIRKIRQQLQMQPDHIPGLKREILSVQLF